MSCAIPPFQVTPWAYCSEPQLTGTFLHWNAASVTVLLSLPRMFRPRLDAPTSISLTLRHSPSRPSPAGSTGELFFALLPGIFRPRLKRSSHYLTPQESLIGTGRLHPYIHTDTDAKASLESARPARARTLCPRRTRSSRTTRRLIRPFQLLP